MESLKINTESRERKDAIIESLSQQVTVVKELIHQADELSTLPAHEAEAALLEIENGLLAKLPEETQERYKKLLLAREKLRKLQLDIEAIGNLDSDTETIDDAVAELRDTLDNEQQTTEQEILSLSNTQTNFIDVTTAGISDLRIKTARLADLRANVASDEAELSSEHNTKLNFSDTEILDVRTDAFSTVHLIEKEAWIRERGPQSRGVYVPKTSNIYVRGSLQPRRIEKTIRHERIHNLLAGFETHQIVHPNVLIRNKISRLQTFKRMKAPDALFEVLIQELTSEAFLKKLLNCIHNEFLAEFEEASARSFSIKPNPGQLNYIEEDANADLNITDVTSTLSTAGKHIRDTLNTLDTLPGTIINMGLPEYAEQVTGLKVKFERMFLSMIEDLLQQINTAKFLGQEAEADVTALLHLLKPAQYHHIKTYLLEMYGEDEVKQGEKFYSLIFERKISLKALQEITEDIKSGSFQPNEEIAEDIANSSIFAYFESTPTDTEYIEMRNLSLELLTLISEKYPLLDIEVDTLALEINHIFFSRLLKESIPDLIKTLESLPEEFFSPNERDGIKELFEFAATKNELLLLSQSSSRLGIVLDT